MVTEVISMSQNEDKCYFCDHNAEYDQVVPLDSGYSVSGVCKNHLRMGLSA
jgi:hypothetical protein